jgi:predicted peroxiredoxin
MKTVLMWFARMLLKAAADKALNKAVEKAVQVAEKSKLPGDEKMKAALKSVQDSGVKALADETKSSLKTLIELKIDELGV